jgi:hypothetical protein
LTIRGYQLLPESKFFDLLQETSHGGDTFIHQFYYGGKYSGAPFHAHGPAFNVLIFGKKHWLILPPGMIAFLIYTSYIPINEIILGHDVYSIIPPLEWLQKGVSFIT